ncbi:hypothetical protein COLO4_14782 [Corchorus olitorius]|uniref:Uncharacterized protein n=1 Tax=Corchorus olitorius TaxID=93759 RepID=A0A1R3JQU1_9ROSI|nr:hypothetical protein COLO4_14782 [Corchorus olitorius]
MDVGIYYAPVTSTLLKSAMEANTTVFRQITFGFRQKAHALFATRS